MSRLKPLLKELLLRLTATVERLERRPIAADQGLHAVIVLERQHQGGKVNLAAKVETANAFLAGQRVLIDRGITERPLRRRQQPLL